MTNRADVEVAGETESPEQRRVQPILLGVLTLILIATMVLLSIAIDARYLNWYYGIIGIIGCLGVLLLVLVYILVGWAFGKMRS